MKNRQSSCTKFRNSGYHLLLLLLIFSLIVSLLNGCGKGSDEQCNDLNNESLDSMHEAEENYCVVLCGPGENETFGKSDSAPVFVWEMHEGFPKYFILEISYDKKESPCVIGSAYRKTVYFLSEAEWETIKNNAPVIEGKQKIYWRIRIERTINPELGTYYSEWSYFWINWINVE